MTGPDADILPGNCLPIANIPAGEMIHNIELYPGKGAQLVRAAGVAAQLMAKENGMAQVRLPSGEVRYIRENCKATIGHVALAAGLTDLDVGPIGVAHLADGGLAVLTDIADLAGGQTDLRCV